MALAQTLYNLAITSLTITAALMPFQSVGICCTDRAGAGRNPQEQLPPIPDLRPFRIQSPLLLMRLEEQ
jgi:hypothetical protein